MDTNHAMIGMALPARVVEFLQHPYVATLATVSPRGRPQATPVWFLFEDGHFLINSSRGRVKVRNMDANPHVALTVVDPADPDTYVQVTGKVIRVDWEHGARDINRLSLRYRRRPFVYSPGDGPAKRVSFHIQPIRVVSEGLE